VRACARTAVHAQARVKVRREQAKVIVARKVNEAHRL
jgi:hypothetical protein